jgi:hypothetical protein
MAFLRGNLIILILLFSSRVIAQNDTLEKKHTWYKPCGVKIEYAGGFGMVSAGSVFQIIRKLELEVSAGYTPSNYGNIGSVNLLTTYKPFKIRINDKLTWLPFEPGFFATVHIGKNIYLVWPDNYPNEYYHWNSAFRFGPFVSTELNWKLNRNKNSVSVLFHSLTNDLYLATYFTNLQSVEIMDILVFGIGVKYYFVNPH